MVVRRTSAQLLVVGYAGCVLFSGGGPAAVGGEGDARYETAAAIRSCLSGIGPFVPCVNERAMAALERAESEDAVRLDAGLEIARAEGFAPRGVYSFGDNPYDVGAVVEAASSLLSRRTFRWDLSALYPGLQMRIGPTYNGRGTIDFAVDPRRKFDERSLGFGQMIFKRSFLPNLLAAQISIATVVPLMFAAIYFLTTKAFLLSKIALLVTGVVGYGSLFLHYKGGPADQPFGVHPIGGHRPVSGGHHDAFVGDIRGDKFYGHFDGFQQISTSKRSASPFRGVNYFPRDDRATSENPADGNEKEAE